MNKALKLDSRFDIWVLCAVMSHASCSKVTYIHCTYAYLEVSSFMLNHVQLSYRDITCMLPKSSGFNFQKLAVTCVLHLMCVLCFSWFLICWMHTNCWKYTFLPQPKFHCIWCGFMCCFIYYIGVTISLSVTGKRLYLTRHLFTYLFNSFLCFNFKGSTVQHIKMKTCAATSDEPHWASLTWTKLHVAVCCSQTTFKFLWRQ